MKRFASVNVDVEKFVIVKMMVLVVTIQIAVKEHVVKLSVMNN